MFARLDSNYRLLFLLSDVVLLVFTSWQALHHLGLIEGPFAAQRSSYWDMRHCDSVVLDMSPPSVPLRVTPALMWLRAASPWSLVLPDSYSLCLKPPRGHLEVKERDFPWLPESSSVQLNVDVHVVVLPYHQCTLSHVLLIVVAQPKSDLSVEI